MKDGRDSNQHSYFLWLRKKVNLLTKPLLCIILTSLFVCFIFRRYVVWRVKMMAMSHALRLKTFSALIKRTKCTSCKNEGEFHWTELIAVTPNFNWVYWHVDGWTAITLLSCTHRNEDVKHWKANQKFGKQIPVFLAQLVKVAREFSFLKNCCVGFGGRLATIPVRSLWHSQLPKTSYLCIINY